MRGVGKKERLRRMNRDIIAKYKVAFVVSLGQGKKVFVCVCVSVLDSFSCLCSVNRLQTCGEKRASVLQII